MQLRSLGPAILLAGTLAWAQGTLSDYERAQGIMAKGRGLVVDVPGTPTWIGKTDHFWYTRSVKGGTEFMLADAAAGSKKLAFDHDKLAAAISSATGGKYTGITLPFAPSLGGRGGAGRGATPPDRAGLVFADDEKSIEFGTGTTQSLLVLDSSRQTLLRLATTALPPSASCR